MKSEFITYQKFNEPALAGQLADLLDRNQIPYLLAEEATSVNPLANLSNELSREYIIKIAGNDFEQVNQLINERESLLVNDVQKDYYLFDFTDDELMDVVLKADEWSSFDVVLAHKLLKERGKEINKEAQLKLSEERLNMLRQPASSDTLWITLGYIMSLCGGLLGIFIGWHLSNYKKTLPDGDQVFGYSASDRTHGKQIFYIGIISFTVFVLYRITLVYHEI